MQKNLLMTLFLGLLLSATTQLWAEQYPVEHFFKNAEFTAVSLSPDGKHLAAIAPVEGRRNLVVIDRSTKAAKAVTTLTKREVADYAWASNSRLIFSMEEDGNESYGMSAVNIDGTQARNLTKAEGGITLFPRYTRMINRLKDDDKHILVMNNKRKARYPDIYRLNIFNGKMRRVTSNPGNISSWMTDHDGKVRIAITEELSDDKKDIFSSVLYRDNEDAEWTTLMRGKFGDEPVAPVGFAGDNKMMYVLSAEGRDRTALYHYNPETKQLGDMIFGHDSYDVGGPVLSKKDKKLLAVSYVTEKPQLHYIDEEMEAIQKSLDQALPDTVNRIYGWTEDESLALVVASSDRDPGRYYLLQKEPLKLTYLLSRMDRIKPETMVEMKPIQFKARDGLNLHGYLTLPKAADKGAVPLIINPHGGPYGVRDNWGFNQEHQFLANRGYAVLQVNFRGSGGYGHRFQVDAWKQWGLAMQDDLTDAVKWAVQEGIADPERVCIYGGSYGGYAAMAGVTSTPDLYKCAVNMVGVVDLEMLHEWDTKKSHDPSGTLTAWFAKAVGDMNDPADKQRMIDTSPITHIDKIKVPVMIAHGRRDPRVEIKQAEELIDAMEKHNKEFIKIIKTKEGHGFRKEENRLEYYKMMDEFFKQHI